jgi:hypothetical protein
MRCIAAVAVHVHVRNRGAVMMHVSRRGAAVMVYVRGRAAVVVDVRGGSVVMMHDPIGTADVHHAIGAVMDDLIGAVIDHAIGAVNDDTDPVGAADVGPAHGIFDHTGQRHDARTGRNWSGDDSLGSDPHGLEKRFAVAVAFQIEALEAVPVSFEDHQRPAIVPAVELTYLLTSMIDNAKLVFLLALSWNLETDLDLEVLLWAFQ